jgi:hypothetical protein
MVEFCHIWNSNSSNDLGWRNDRNQSCRSRKVIKVVDNFFIWIHFGSQVFISKPKWHKMRWTNIPNGHKHLTCGVVRWWRYEAGGRGFERRWLRSRMFFAWKIAWLVKIFPIFQPIFGFSENHISVGFLEPAMMCTLHHCRFGCASSKSGSEGGSWTGSDLKIWDSAMYKY